MEQDETEPHKEEKIEEEPNEEAKLDTDTKEARGTKRKECEDLLIEPVTKKVAAAHSVQIPTVSTAEAEAPTGHIAIKSVAETAAPVKSNKSGFLPIKRGVHARLDGDPIENHVPLYGNDILNLAIKELFDSKWKQPPAAVKWCSGTKLSQRCVVILLNCTYDYKELCFNTQLFKSEHFITMLFKTKQNVLEMLMPAVALITNAGNVCKSANPNKSSWKLAVFKLNYIVKHLYDVFDVIEQENTRNVSHQRTTKITSLLLSPSEMADIGYPLPGSLKSYEYEFLHSQVMPVSESSDWNSLDTENTGDPIMTCVKNLGSLVNPQASAYRALIHSRYGKREESVFGTRFPGLIKSPEWHVLLSNIKENPLVVREELKHVIKADSIIIAFDGFGDFRAGKFGHAFIIDPRCHFIESNTPEVRKAINDLKMSKRKPKSKESTAKSDHDSSSSRSATDTSDSEAEKGGSYVNPSLKYLSKYKLGEDIQQVYHDAGEDALAALKLVKLKIDKGLEYGNQILQDSLMDTSLYKSKCEGRVSILASSAETEACKGRLQELIEEAGGDPTLVNNNLQIRMSYESCEDTEKLIQELGNNGPQSKLTLASIPIKERTLEDTIKTVNLVTDKIIKCLPKSTTFFFVMKNNESEDGSVFLGKI